MNGFARRRRSLLAVGGFLAVMLAALGCATAAKVRQIETVTAVPGLDVDVSTWSTQGMRLKVHNATDEFWKLVWDECSYVTPDGRAVRILKEVGSEGDQQRTQPVSPLPPGATIEELCWLDAASFPNAYNTSPGEPLIYLAFARGDSLCRWSGRLHFAPPPTRRASAVGGDR